MESIILKRNYYPRSFRHWVRFGL